MTDPGFVQAVLTSAEEAFARVMSGAEEQVQRMPPDLEPADALRWAGDRVTELLAGLADLPLDRLLLDRFPSPEGSPGAAGPARSASTDDHDSTPGSRTAQGEPLVLRGTPGGLAETRVWVHVTGKPPVDTLRLTLGELVGPDGRPWSSPQVSFAPAELSLREPVASAVLRLQVPDGTVSGDHHGLVIGRGLTGAVVPISVIIT